MKDEGWRTAAFPSPPLRDRCELSSLFFILHPSALILALPRQPLVKILTADTEDPGRLSLVAFGRGQSLANIFALDLGQCRPLSFTLPACRGHAHALRQISRFNLRANGNNYCALNDVRQLANVAGKIVSQQKLPGPGGNLFRGPAVF